MKFSKYIMVASVVVLFSVACSNGDDITTQRRLRQKLSGVAKSKFTKKVKKKYGFTVAGSGGAERDGKTSSFEMVFDSKRLFNVDEIPEARLVLLNLIEEFLQDVNNNEKLKPFLYQYPFPSKNVRIVIISHVPRLDKDKYMESFSISSDRLGYCKTSDKEIGPLRPLLEETYKEALKIVAKAKGNELNSIDTK